MGIDFNEDDLNDEIKEMSSFGIFCLQFKAMFLKRWYSFKRDWRMWLIMVLPALIIALFLTVGFQREYRTADGLKYTNQLIGSSTMKNTTEMTQDEISQGISTIAKMSNNGGRDIMNAQDSMMDAMNFSSGA